MNLLIKSILYRIFRIILLIGVSFFILGDITTALSISGIDAVVATAYYYYYDAIWSKYLDPFVAEVLIKIKYRKMK